MTPDWTWTLLYEPCAKIGDTFFLVSPDSIFLYTANAEAITQITAKSTAFPRPVQSYTLLNLFGRNVVSTEGDVWKTHRKIISPNINERNNGLVFVESISEAKQMLARWSRLGQSQTLTQIPPDIMQLALHIITQVGFGVKLTWPSTIGMERKEADRHLGEGHTMSFAYAIDTVLSCLVGIALLPSWFLRGSASSRGYYMADLTQASCLTSVLWWPTRRLKTFRDTSTTCSVPKSKKLKKGR